MACVYFRMVSPRFLAGAGSLFLALSMQLALATHAAAQSDISAGYEPVELEPVVVTGTFIPTPPAQNPASLTVITREEMEARQESSVTELLRHIPGLHIDQAGARGSVSSVYLRGGDPNYTVVLMDGIRVNDPTNSRGGSFDFSTLDADNIERIEIVRGPLSSVYGSDAMTGVIQIISLRGTDEPVSGLSVSGGRSGHFRTLVQTRSKIDRFDYSLSGSYLDHGEPVEGSGFVNRTFNANGGLLLSHTSEIRSVLRYADSHLESFPDDSGGPTFAVFRDVDQRDANELTFGIEMTHRLLLHWDTRLDMGYYDRQEEIDSPGVAPGVRDPFGIPAHLSDNLYRRYDLSFRNLFRIGKGLRLTMGGEVQSEKGSSRGSLSVEGVPVPTSFDFERDLLAPFLEAQYTFSTGLLLQAGARLDVPEDLDSQLSSRFGISYKIPSTDTRLRASWGEGFKLPSFFSLSHPIVGNPGLVPEASRSADVAVIQPLWGEHVNMSATYFSNRFENAIDFEEGPPPLLVNRSEITTEGVEMAMDAKAGRDLDLSSHLTYVKTDIKGTQEELRNRPKWRGGFTAGWHPVPALVVHLGTFYVGSVLDSSIPTGDRTLDDYARVDLAMTWTANPAWQYFLAVDNVLNVPYEEAVGFPSPGITPRIGFRARW